MYNKFVWLYEVNIMIDWKKGFAWEPVCVHSNKAN